MGVLDRLKGLLGLPALPAGEADAFYLYLRCSRCGELLRVRIRRGYELQQEFDERGDAVAGYTLAKDVVGSRCNRLIRVEMRFDRSFRELSREAQGAEFISAEEYQAGRSDR